MYLSTYVCFRYVHNSNYHSVGVIIDYTVLCYQSITLVAEEGFLEMAIGYASVPKYFSDGDACEWLQRFEICCSVNQWNNETMV